MKSAASGRWAELDFLGTRRRNEGNKEIIMRNTKAAKQDALKEYEARQAEIRKLLKQIEAGLQKHDREASSNAGGHHWGHVGDLTSIAETLTDLRDRLHGTGEYAEVG
jgi:hypothetical protein